MEITGRLTRDAKVLEVGSNNVVNFSVAVNDSYKNNKGEKVTLTEYFDCSYWLGKGIAPYLTRGSVVGLFGWVSTRAWLSDGIAKAGLNFRVSKITLQGGGTKPQPGEANQGQAHVQDPSGVEVYEAEIIQGQDRDADDLPF